MTTTRNARRTMRGTVVSDRMDKTIAVRIERTYRHPKYGKYVRTHAKYLAHDEEQQAKPGDLVEIVSTRPYSKTKRWRLGRVLVVNTLPGASEAEAEGGEG